MHRQSLGSPGSKLHSHGGAKEENLLTEEDQNRNDLSCSPTDNDEDNDKSQKPHKSPPRAEKFVHIIPVLTVLCFLILYLSSHNPIQKDLTQFNEFKRSSKPMVVSTEIDEIGKGDVLAIRRLKNLQEIGRRGPKHRFHRKISDF